MKNKIAVIILTVCAVFGSTVIFAETNTFEDITEK